MTSLLDDLINRIQTMTPEERAEAEAMADQATGNMVWIPQPGPQTEAYLSEADEVFYGGQAGGGKTDLGLGLALTAHKRTLVLRRVGKEARKMLERVEGILGHNEGRNLSTGEWKVDGRVIEFQGCEHEKDKERFKGIPHDLKFFDEIPDFSESMFRFIKTWNRSAEPGQRSRVMCTGNPPTTPEGLWVIEYWAPWLDPRHPNPAKSGELRWFISDDNGRDKEVPGPGSYPLHDDNGNPRLKPDGTPDTVLARSRTFIRARLEDNQYYGDDYAAVLDALPAALRSAYRDGRFDQSIKDALNQMIPTAWVMAAVERGRAQPKPPRGVPMCAIGVDPTGGGKDEFTLAPRYDGWFAPLTVLPAKSVPYGSDQFAQLLKIRRDNALPVIDIGGGYGSGIVTLLKENSIEFATHMGSEASSMRDKSKKLRMKNRRTAVYWAFMEALDPDQDGGSDICLPDDPKLIADLTAVTFSVGTKGVEAESKEDLVKRLGRSPDRGDAVVNSWSCGIKAANIEGGWENHTPAGRNRSMPPKAVMGHTHQRRR